MDTQTLRGKAKAHGHRAKRHPAVDFLARIGFVAYGVVYCLLGWLALQLATGDRDGAVDKDGALHQLAEQPIGSVVLWAAAVGLAGLAVWELLEAFLGGRSSDGKKRALHRFRAVTRMVIFALLSYSSVQVALGNGSGSGTDGYTAQLMRQPMGPWLVGGVGLAIMGFAIASVVIGLTDRYEKELDLDGRTGRTGTALAVLARVGYCSRGLAFGIMGGLFIWAALSHDPQKSGGLDQALGRLLKAPFGPALLVLVAAGFACYGIFNIAKAKHLRN